MPKVSQLPSGSPSDDDQVAANDGGVTKRFSLAQLKSYIFGSTDDTATSLPVFKASCSDTTTGINKNTLTKIPFDGTVFDKGSGVITRSGATLTLTQPGVYEIFFNAEVLVGNDRDAPLFTFQLNGVTIAERIGNTYMRNQQNHDSSTGNAPIGIEVTEANSTLEVFSQRAANGSGSAKLNGNTTIYVKRI